MMRPGTALVEVMVAAVLAGLVAAAGATLLRAQAQIARQVTQRSEHTDAMRSAVLTLRADLEMTVPALDIRSVARDSLLLRVFRGIAEVCSRQDDEVYIRYRGLRLPDPAKDSLLAVGIETAVRLDAAQPQPSACVAHPGETVWRIGINTAAPPGSLWLVFESGSYHLQAHALRYRPAGGNRQPLTNEVVDHTRSGFTIADSGTAFHIQLFARHGFHGAASTFHFPNAP